MSEQDVEQKASEIKSTRMEAWQYNKAYERIQSMPPDRRERGESFFILYSLSRGLPVVVTEEGTLVTPLNVWSQMKERYQHRPKDQVTEKQLTDLLGGAAIHSTALLKTGPIQEWAEEIRQIQVALGQFPQQ